MWLLLDTHSTGTTAGAPPPTPIQQPFAVTGANPGPSTNTQEGPEPTVQAANADVPTAALEKEASAVRAMLLFIHHSLADNRLADAQAAATRCLETYPKNQSCQNALQLIQAKLANANTPSDIRPKQPSPLPADRPTSPSTLSKNINEIQITVNNLNKQGRTHDALEVAQACVDGDPKIPECHLMLGVLYAKLKEFKRSEQHYETFVALTPDGYPKRDRVIEILKNSTQ
ncbi:hypothetical protein [Corallococcus sp. M7]